MIFKRLMEIKEEQLSLERRRTQLGVHRRNSLCAMNVNIIEILKVLKGGKKDGKNKN